MCFQSQVHAVQQQTEDVLSDMEAFLALDGHEDEVAISAWPAGAAVQNKSSFAGKGEYAVASSARTRILFSMSRLACNWYDLDRRQHFFELKECHIGKVSMLALYMYGIWPCESSQISSASLLKALESAIWVESMHFLNLSVDSDRQGTTAVHAQTNVVSAVFRTAFHSTQQDCCYSSMTKESHSGLELCASCLHCVF